jgi:hypothetical protein
MRIAAIIPVGTLEGAKTRLAGRSMPRSDTIVEGLLARTVETALTVDRLGGVWSSAPTPRS